MLYHKKCEKKNCCFFTTQIFWAPGIIILSSNKLCYVVNINVPLFCYYHNPYHILMLPIMHFDLLFSFIKLYFALKLCFSDLMYNNYCCPYTIVKYKLCKWHWCHTTLQSKRCNHKNIPGPIAVYGIEDFCLYFSFDWNDDDFYFILKWKFMFKI